MLTRHVQSVIAWRVMPSLEPISAQE